MASHSGRVAALLALSVLLACAVVQAQLVAVPAAAPAAAQAAADAAAPAPAPAAAAGAAATAAAAAAAAPAAATAAADFGAQLVAQAVDLSAAHSDAQNDDARSMESLLHWAIEHSDTDKLRQQAEQVQKEEAVKDFLERKQRVKELSDIVSQQPTESQLMMDHIAALGSADASAADKAAALAALQILVEPIDNANDLKVLGGLQPLVALLAPGQPAELQEGAAYALGTAASNNAQLASVLVHDHPELLQRLLQLAGEHASPGAASKAMYALARLVAGPSPAARAAFYAGGGLPGLQRLLSGGSGASQRVKTRAMNLIADLIELTATGDDTSLDTWDERAMASFAAAALELLQQSDALDVKEKALHAMRTLLVRRGAAGGAALANEGAEGSLREELTQLDLLAERLAASAAAAAATDGQPEAEGDDSAADEVQYAQYLAALAADVLHHLSVHHTEL